MVSEVAGKYPRLFQEHAHVAQLRELRFGHLAFVSQDELPSVNSVPLSLPAALVLAQPVLPLFTRSGCSGLPDGRGPSRRGGVNGFWGCGGEGSSRRISSTPIVGGPRHLPGVAVLLPLF